MTRPTPGWGALALALAIALAGSADAFADNDVDEQAKHHYQQGYDALQRGNYAEALSHYERSYELVPRPRTLFNIAVSEEMLGRLDDALHHYALFIGIAEDRDGEFKAQAERKLSELAERLADGVDVVSDPPGPAVPIDRPNASDSVQPVVLSRPPSGGGALHVHSNTAGATVSVDGIVVGTTAATADADEGGATFYRALGPGNHDVIVERSGATAWHQRLHISPGETVRVDIAFRDTHVSRTKILTWGLAGVGTVSIAAGATLGVLALRDVTSADAADHDRGKSRALLTDALIAGGALAIYGAWRLADRPKTTATVNRTHEDTGVAP